jgi:hypothetical protein
MSGHIDDAARIRWAGLRGLLTYYVLFFIHLESRKVDIAGITVHPHERWMQQMARNMTMEGCGAVRDCRYLLHDRDTHNRSGCPSCWWPSTPRVSLAERSEKREYSRQFESHLGTG